MTLQFASCYCDILNKPIVNNYETIIIDHYNCQHVMALHLFYVSHFLLFLASINNNYLQKDFLPTPLLGLYQTIRLSRLDY